MSDNATAEWMMISEAAAAYGVSAPTLRRLCDQGVLPARRQGRNWTVRAIDVRRYLMARPAAGAQRASFRLEGPAPTYRGEAPNPRLRDAEGFRFQVALSPEKEVPFSIWLSRELVEMLADEGRDPRDLVVRGAESLAQEVALEHETLPKDHEILLDSRDRLRLLRAAGLNPDSYRPSEAPLEEGALVVYDFTARDTVWVGDRLHFDDSADGWTDLVVGWTYLDGRRRVRTIRLREPQGDSRRALLVRAAIAAYRRRCRRHHQQPGEWLKDLAAQLPSVVTRGRKSA